MNHLEYDIIRSLDKLSLSEESTFIQQERGYSPALEYLCTEIGTPAMISQEGIRDVIDKVKQKIISWVNAFKQKIQSLFGKNKPEEFSDNVDYEMPVSEETGKKYTALKVAGIALAAITVAWLLKGGAEVGKSKLELHRFKRGLKQQAKQNSQNYTNYIKGGEPYQQLQKKGTLSGWLNGKARMERAKKQFDYQLMDLKRLEERDKRRMAEQIKSFKHDQRRHNGFLWAGHRVKEASIGKTGFITELLKILGKFLSGISQSFGSKGPNDESVGLGRFLAGAIKGFFQVFGKSLWTLLKHMASLLRGARPITGR